MVENVRKISRNPIKAIHENDNEKEYRRDKDETEKDDFKILEESI